MTDDGGVLLYYLPIVREIIETLFHLANRFSKVSLGKKQVGLTCDYLEALLLVLGAVWTVSSGYSR